MTTQATIRMSGNFPAFIGDQKSGYSLNCRTCAQSLVQYIYDRQVLDLFIECPNCKTVNSTQQRDSGEAIPTRHIKILNGGYNFSDPVDVKSKPEAIIGENATEDYRKEIGYKHLPSDSAKELNESFLGGLASEGVSLLGKETYKRHLTAIKKSEASKTPKANYHRLVELVQYALASAEKLKKSDGKEVALNGDLIAELWAIVNLFGRWRNHPAWEGLAASLANSNDVQHNLTQLAFASVLADKDNGVGIIFGNSSGRIPDLYVRPTYNERLEVEVKTPTALHGPIDNLSAEEATKIIERQFNKGASSKSGQINPLNSGFFVLGGFHIKQELLTNLEEAARIILRRRKNRKHHVMAIVICSHSYEYSTIVDQTGRVVNRGFRPLIGIKIIKHPGYKGQLKLSGTS